MKHYYGVEVQFTEYGGNTDLVSFVPVDIVWRFRCNVYLQFFLCLLLSCFL